MKDFPYFLVLLASVALSFVAGRELTRRREPMPMTDTVRYVDTVRIASPSPVRDSVIVRYVIRRLPLAAPDTLPNSVAAVGRDTLRPSIDSADVELPVVQRMYDHDLYRAYVSGYQPRLDSLILYQPREVLTIERHKRWGIGPYIGVDISGRGVSVGVSLQCSIVRF